MNNNSKQPRPEYKSDKSEVSIRYFIVGGQMAGCRHILTGLLHLFALSHTNQYVYTSCYEKKPSHLDSILIEALIRRFTILSF